MKIKTLLYCALLLMGNTTIKAQQSTKIIDAPASQRQHKITQFWTDRTQIQSAASLSASPLTLCYARPAGVWEEALPLGNGQLGAMFFGGVADERIQLNESTLWAGHP